MDEERIIELETRIAFQEKSLEELNQALIGQQHQLDLLEQRLTAALARLAADPSGSQPGE